MPKNSPSHADPPEDLMAALQEATCGLLYLSETDEPFEAVQWPGEGPPPDAKGMLQRLGRKPGEAVQTETLEDFFADLTTEQDWHGEQEREDMRRYRYLRSLIESRLTGAQVFRVGKRQVEIYIIGQTDGGDWAGVRTKAVET